MVVVVVSVETFEFDLFFDPLFFFDDFFFSPGLLLREDLLFLLFFFSPLRLTTEMGKIADGVTMKVVAGSGGFLSVDGSSGCDTGLILDKDSFDAALLSMLTIIFSILADTVSFLFELDDFLLDSALARDLRFALLLSFRLALGERDL